MAITNLCPSQCWVSELANKCNFCVFEVCRKWSNCVNMKLKNLMRSSNCKNSITTKLECDHTTLRCAWHRGVWFPFHCGSVNYSICSENVLNSYYVNSTITVGAGADPKVRLSIQKISFGQNPHRNRFEPTTAFRGLLHFHWAITFQCLLGWIDFKART